MKLAHLADLHLGFGSSTGKPSRGANQREVDIAEAFKRAVDDLLEQKPQLVVYRGRSVSLRQADERRDPLLLPPAPSVAHGTSGLAHRRHRRQRHDTPRSTETGSILRLYEALGVEIAVEDARRIVLAQARLRRPRRAAAGAQPKADRPCPSPRARRSADAECSWSPTGCTVVWVKSAARWSTAARSSRAELLAPEKWDYIALGHYHTAQSIAANAWYAGSLEYLPPNPWGQIQDEPGRGKGKEARAPARDICWSSCPGARRRSGPSNRCGATSICPFIQGAGLTAKELDGQIAERVASAKIDDQIVRARGVGRGPRCGPRSGSRGNPRLQGARAQLPARSAATAGSRERRPRLPALARAGRALRRDRAANSSDAGRWTPS